MGTRGFRVLALCQGLYYIGTSVWALSSPATFQWATGPKTDVWLVNAVAVLLIAIGLSILVAGVRREPSLEITVLAIAASAGLYGIDVYYALWAQIISPVYLLDAVLEVVFAGAWATVRRPRMRIGTVNRAHPYPTSR